MTGDYCIYKHTSPSGKVYVGVTKQKPEARWRNGIGYKENEYFSRAICKYGWDNFGHEIIAECLSYEDAANMEIDLIAIYGATNADQGYNIDHGGRICGRIGEETRKKMSIAMMGKNKGKKASPETRAKMSKASIGKTFSEHTRLLLSENHAKKRAVEQLDLNGNVIARFGSLIDAAKSVNASRGKIGKVCRGCALTCRGHKWRYCDENCK